MPGQFSGLSRPLAPRTKTPVTNRHCDLLIQPGNFHLAVAQPKPPPRPVKPRTFQPQSSTNNSSRRALARGGGCGPSPMCLSIFSIITGSSITAMSLVLLPVLRHLTCEPRLIDRPVSDKHFDVPIDRSWLIGDYRITDVFDPLLPAELLHSVHSRPSEQPLSTGSPMRFRKNYAIDHLRH